MRAGDPEMVEQRSKAGLDQRLFSECKSASYRYSPLIRQVYPDVLGRSHPLQHSRKNQCSGSLSAPGGGEGWGEVGDSRALADTHLTLPSLRRWAPPSPPKGGEGNPLVPSYALPGGRPWCSRSRLSVIAGAAIDVDRPAG